MTLQLNRRICCKWEVTPEAEEPLVAMNSGVLESFHMKLMLPQGTHVSLNASQKLGLHEETYPSFYSIYCNLYSLMLSRL